MGGQAYKGAGVLIRSPIGFLMQHRDDKPGVIYDPGMVSFFGGAMEPSDKSPRDAAFRELREETSLEFAIGDLRQFIELSYAVTTVNDHKDRSEFFLFLLETDATEFEVYEGQGIYVLQFDASLGEHNLSPLADMALRAYLEKTKEG